MKKRKREKVSRRGGGGKKEGKLISLLKTLTTYNGTEQTSSRDAT